MNTITLATLLDVLATLKSARSALVIAPGNAAFLAYRAVVHSETRLEQELEQAGIELEIDRRESA